MLFYLFITHPCFGTFSTISSNSLSTLDSSSLDKAYKQSIASRLAAISASEDGFGATDGGAVCTACLQMVVYCVTHGELSHACLCPVDKGIDSRFSCLSVFIVCHNSDVWSLLKQFDTYPNSDFYKDNCPTSKCQAEHPCISAAIEVSTFFNISDAFKFHLLVSE